MLARPTDTGNAPTVSAATAVVAASTTQALDGSGTTQGALPDWVHAVSYTHLTLPTIYSV